MTIATASKKLNKATKAFLLKAIYEVVRDPDFGLEFTSKAKERLSQTQSRNARTTALSAIKEKYY